MESFMYYILSWRKLAKDEKSKFELFSIIFTLFRSFLLFFVLFRSFLLFFDIFRSYWILFFKIDPKLMHLNFNQPY